MENLQEIPYTVIDQEKVKDKLNLSTAPVGLVITNLSSSCAVEIVPPDPDVQKIEVSNDLLKQLYEDGAIEEKK